MQAKACAKGDRIGLPFQPMGSSVLRPRVHHVPRTRVSHRFRLYSPVRQLSRWPGLLPRRRSDPSAGPSLKRLKRGAAPGKVVAESATSSRWRRPEPFVPFVRKTASRSGHCFQCSDFDLPTAESALQACDGATGLTPCRHADRQGGGPMRQRTCAPPYACRRPTT